MRALHERAGRLLLGISMVLALVLSFTISVHAAEDLDLSRNGTLTISVVKSDGTPIGGGSLTVYQAGTIEKDADGNPKFILHSDFAGSKADLSDLQSRLLPEQLAEYAKNNEITGRKVQISEDGEADFGETAPGLYLLVQEDPADGYRALHPFVCSVPQYDEVSKSYVYDVTAFPKMELDLDIDSSDESSESSSTSSSQSSSASSSESSQSSTSSSEKSTSSSKDKGSSDKSNTSSKDKTDKSDKAATASISGLFIYAGLFLIAGGLLILFWQMKKNSAK